MRNVLLVMREASILVSVVPALAHHSFAAEYDATKQIMVTGTVTKFESMNRHARFYLDVKNVDGTVTNWNFELGPANILARNVWTKNSLNDGDQISVAGNPATDASQTANARTLMLSDRRRVFAGSSADNRKHE